MNATERKTVHLPGEEQADLAGSLSERRADIDSKHALVTEFLQKIGCEGVLLLSPENFAWLGCGASSRNVLDPDERPALYFSIDQRWLLSANVDSQRLFDEELDGLGFQLKEWPWHWKRDPFFSALRQGRAIASDLPFPECKLVGSQLARMRCTLTPYEESRLCLLGKVLRQALEATCRTLAPGISEREAAGQVGHRLLQRGAQPLAIGVAADDRSRLYRRYNATETPIRRHAVVTATALRDGLCATASRSVCFGSPDAVMRQEYDAACKVTATFAFSATANAVPREILQTCRRVYQMSGFEHEWLCSPQGCVTGRKPVELPFLPSTEDLLQPHWAITVQSTIGMAASCDTFLVTDHGVEPITAPESWPLKHIRIQGKEIYRPYLLVRGK